MNLETERTIDNWSMISKYQIIQIRNLDEKLSKLRDMYVRNSERIKEIETRAKCAKKFDNLEKQNFELTKKIAELYAKIELYKNFQTEINNGFYPMILVKKLKKKDKDKVLKFIEIKLSEVISQIRKYQSEQKVISIELKISQKAKNFLGQLDTLRIRELEISDEGKLLRGQKEAIERELEELRISNLLNSTNKNTGITLPISTEDNKCTVGSNFLRIAEFFFSTKTCNEVFYQIVGDWREEYLTALRKGRIFKAIWISLTNYSYFSYTILIYSKFGKLIEFFKKITEIIELLNKFFK